MAKKPAKRGRPPTGNALELRLMVRLSPEVKAALKHYAVRTGARQEATAARIIIMEKLAAENLLS